MNKAIIIGNLTRDPESRVTQSGISVCTFTVAVTRRFKRDETDFIPIVVWRGLADNCVKYLHKGSKAAISGEIQTRSYDAQDGTKRYVTEIVADDVQFLDRAPGSGDMGNRIPPPDDQDAISDFNDIEDVDLPF